MAPEATITTTATTNNTTTNTTTTTTNTTTIAVTAPPTITNHSDITNGSTHNNAQDNNNIINNSVQDSNNNIQNNGTSSIGPIKPTKRPKRKRQPKNNKHKMITGYIIYASEIRKEVIKKYPEKDFGDISKLVGIEWKNLPQETKVAYEKRAQEQNNVSRMLNEKAEAALELMKLADTAVAREMEQQHHPHQHQQPQSQQMQIQQQPTRQQPTNPHQEQQAQHQLHPTIHAPLEASASESFHSQQQSHQLSQQQVATLMAEHHHHHQQQQQQQHHQKHQSPLPASDPCNSSITGLNCNGGSHANVDLNNNANNNNIAPLGLERAFVSQHQDLSFVHQQPQPQLIAQSYPTAPFAQDFYYNYGQPPTMPIPYMNQSTPILARSLNDNHNGALQQQPPMQAQPQQPQPLQIIQHQQQQPVTTMVQYCSGSCCCGNGTRPYPTAITPSQSPAPSYQYPPLPASAPLQSRRNNIVYRKPSLVRLRPKDASTQTDPVKWADKITTEQPKKTLKFSQKFIDYLNCSSPVQQ